MTDITQEATLTPLNLASSTPQQQVISVTPEIATEMLEHNTGNRTIKAGAVNMYARDMLSGNWQFTADPIRFDTTGRLLDGQQRLSAIIQSGATITMLVVTGLAPETQEVMDSGVKRTAADQLSMKGVTSSALIASAVRLAILYEREALFAKGTNPSTTDILRWFEEHPDIADYQSMTWQAKHLVGGSPSMYLFALWETNMISVADADSFWKGLISGADLADGDPRLAYRQMWVRALQTSKNRTGTPLSQQRQLFAITRVWNAYRSNETLQVVRFPKKLTTIEFK